ncbi:Bax inhibitor-1/YccA family protein [Rhizohabitans arisaemae]|uniref:Bax inhibitor-1/YccA family protein n=1 Tax=Rhizohabitans arisaemae TaxID=2720610 RepID=UPI0024B0AC5D|nr:Bax inhibitor-1/YccA family protein [Rhizohabitans arisaemae]
MESKNPVFSRRGSAGKQAWSTPTPGQLQEMYDTPSYAPVAAGRTMTIDDVVIRGFLTLGTLVASAAVAWWLDLGLGVAIGAMIVGVILGLIVSFKQSTNPVLILGYALSYGVVVGVVSNIFNDLYNGIVMQAVLGTAFAFAGTLAAYTLRVVRVTPKFVRFVVAASIAALGLVLVNLLVGLTNEGVGFGLRTDSWLGWVFSAAMILLGCFFLLLDFAMIEDGVREGAPEKFAWLCAFGLTVSLVWIYLEVLRLLSYFSSSD